MNRICTLAIVFALARSAVVRAQDNPFSDDAPQTYALIKGSLLKAADKMPAESYSFRAVSEVRTFGEMIAHVADAQFLMCGVVKGERPAADARSKTLKPDLVTALKASFDSGRAGSENVWAGLRPGSSARARLK